MWAGIWDFCMREHIWTVCILKLSFRSLRSQNDIKLWSLPKLLNTINILLMAAKKKKKVFQQNHSWQCLVSCDSRNGSPPRPLIAGLWRDTSGKEWSTLTWRSLGWRGEGDQGREIAHTGVVQTTQLESYCSPLLALRQLLPPSLPRGGLVCWWVPPLDPLCGGTTSWVGWRWAESWLSPFLRDLSHWGWARKISWNTAICSHWCCWARWMLTWVNVAREKADVINPYCNKAQELGWKFCAWEVNSPTNALFCSLPQEVRKTGLWLFCCL